LHFHGNIYLVIYGGIELRKVENILMAFLIILAGATIVGGVTLTIIAYQIGVENLEANNRSTIIGGLLSMAGGAVGAMGAYMVARHQMKNEKKENQKRNELNARPIIICNDFRGPYNLEGVKLHPDAKILYTDFYHDLKELAKSNNTFMGFFQLKFTGETKVIKNCEINIVMDQTNYKENSNFNTYIGPMNNGEEIFIPLPITQVEETLTAVPIRLELQYITVEGEKILFIYNHKEKYEEYYLIKSEERILLTNYQFDTGDWILPAKLEKRTNNKDLELKTINDKFYKLYHPLYTLIQLYDFENETKKFTDLNKEQINELMCLIIKYDIYAEKNLYVRLIKIKSAYKNDLEQGNQIYEEIKTLTADTVYKMKIKLGLPI